MSLSLDDKMHPLVSVIIPVYKTEKYLRQCLNSVVRQTYRNLEILLIDDGSPDNCGLICDEYASMDPRIKVIHQNNMGVSAARNAGLELASGEFIAFVDSDDFVAEDMIDTMVCRIVSENAELVICNAGICNDKNEIWSCDSPITDRKYTLNEFVDEYQAWQYIPPWNKIYRSFLFENIWYPVGYIHEDNAVIHHILSRCKTIITIPAELYFYRESPGSIMRSPVSIKRTDDLSALADKIQFAYKKKWSAFWNNASSRYVLLFFELYFRFPQNAENEPYFNRMNESLRKALPYLIQSSEVSFRHKIYLLLIRINPRLFVLLQRLINSGTTA